MAGEWQQTVCILCECNCGIEVRLDDRRVVRVRGDKSHVASRGYTCEKALRIDHYQNGRHRINSPLRRRRDGTYEPVDWDTAIREVAAGLGRVRDTHGGETILYYGGGGQGNHLGGAYSPALRAALGSVYRSNALAQEKTGEFWVNAHLGVAARGDFEHTDVAVFLGKNPWQSHGIARARRTLKEIANDPDRTLIVIDPRRTETAELADIHLQVKPGTDAFCLSAMLAVLVEDDLLDHTFIREHVVGAPEVLDRVRSIDPSAYAIHCGVDEALLRAAATTIGRAASVAVFEDLGVQMAPHSTLNSYVNKLIWILTGNYGKPGAMYTPSYLTPLGRANARSNRRSPVSGARVIAGMVPCNVIAEETLADHPGAYRAMIIESANPAHSLADSPGFRQAMEALEFSVVIDVAFTETARLADYVLPASSQYEKWETTFFNFEFPENVFTLRAPILDPLPGTLPEPEIHYRLVRELGALDDAMLERLTAAARVGRAEFAQAFSGLTASDPLAGRLAPVILYATLGQTLEPEAAATAVLWAASHQLAMREPAAVRRAGFDEEGFDLGEALFDAILTRREGVVISRDRYEDAFRRISTDDGKIHVAIPELFGEWEELTAGPDTHTTPEYPFVLAAGERRSFTANTIFRDPGWRKRDAGGALRISPQDADRLSVQSGSRVRVTTRRGSVETVAEVTDTLRSGHITLPNGLGVDYPTAGGELELTGPAPNELTWIGHQDPIAGTPWHKHVPARVEVVG